MNTSTSITLITCTYNAQTVLQRTLDSVISQDYPNIEHLIIDGRSTDDTLRMAEQYSIETNERHCGHNVIIVSEHDDGLYDAMNKGLQMASGEYLCFLNAGDTLPDTTTIRTIAQQLAPKQITPEQPAPQQFTPGRTYGVVYGETDVVDDNGTFLYHRHHHAPETLTWRSFQRGMLVCHQAFYANTRIARQTPYDLRYRLSADVDWCIRVMKKAESEGLRNLNTHRVLVNYLAGGMSIKNHRASLIERFRIMASHYGLPTTILQHIRFLLKI